MDIAGTPLHSSGDHQVDHADYRDFRRHVSEMLNILSLVQVLSTERVSRIDGLAQPTLAITIKTFQSVRNLMLQA